MGADDPDNRTWLRAHDAVAYLETAYSKTSEAQNAIIGWAASGLVASRCLRKEWETSGPESQRTESNDNSIVEGDFWKKFADLHHRKSTDWVSGSFVIQTHAPTRWAGKSQSTYERIFGVEFCKDDLGQMVTPAPKTRAQDSPIPPPVASPERGALETYGYATIADRSANMTDEEAHRAKNDAPLIAPEPSGKPPLSAKNLAHWWSFYRAVTPPEKETEEWAQEYVRVCFPENTVTRARIRELRGKIQKSGRKPKLAE
jgi:hypothetical protein